MSKKLTVKETKLVKGIVAGKSQTQAAKDAGYSPKTATVIASETLTKPYVKEALHQALEKHGITLDRALAPISKGLEATKQNEFTGEITEDIKLQLSASDRALKLMGVGQDKQPEGGVHYHLHQAEQREKYGL